MPEPQGSEPYPGPLYRDERDETEDYPPPSRRRSPSGRGQWGALSGRLGVSIVFGAAAVGLLVTLLTRREPGDLLGAFLVAGTIVAALAVHPRVAYLIIPVPALAYLVTGTIAGLIHDRAADTSHTALAVNGVQWIASGFLTMTAATVLAVAIAAVRWPWRERSRRSGRAGRDASEPGYEDGDDGYRLSAGFRSAHSPWPDN
jgi:hypothetical protein